MESKKYTIAQKILIGLINLIIVLLPILFWVLIFKYLLSH